MFRAGRVVLLIPFVLLLAAACDGDKEQSAEVTQAPSAAQTDDPSEELTVDYCPKWQVGETRTLEITETNERTVQGRDVQAVAVTPVEVVVAEAEPGYYVFEWVYGNAEVSDVRVDGQRVNDAELQSALQQQGDFAEIQELVTGTPFQLETDECGIYLGLANWQEIAATMEGVLEIVFDQLESEAPADSDVDTQALRAVLIERFTSQEGIEALIGDDVGLYYGAFGETYSSKYPVEYDILAPNPFGGEPLPAVSEYALAEYDETTGCGFVEVTSAYDTEEILRIFQHSLAGISEDVGGETPNFDDAPEISIDDSAEYEFCIDSGWPRSVSAERRLRAGPQDRVDTTTIVDKGESRRLPSEPARPPDP